MATGNENKKFTESVFGEYPLDSAIDWIKDNMEPDDVFEDDELIVWANNKRPEVIFSNTTLEEWALENGFVKE